jgi:hypothetical protein
MPRDLSVNDIEAVAAYFKEDLQRDANRAIRRKDPTQALASLEGMEIVDRFLYQLKLKAGSQLGLPKSDTHKKRKTDVASPFDREEAAS